MNNEDYLIKLSDAFRPTNGHSNGIVKVEYVLEPLEINSDLGPKSSQLLLRSSDMGNKEIKHNRVLRQAKECPQKFSLNFRWINSPVYLFINPNLLKWLSLLTYNPSVSKQVNLSFSTPCSCDELKFTFQNITKECSTEKYPVLDLFNNLTSNVS